MTVMKYARTPTNESCDIMLRDKWWPNSERHLEAYLVSFSRGRANGMGVRKSSDFM